jgi:surface antigen
MLQTATSADKHGMFGGFTLRHIPCEECGASVPKAELEGHVCDPERRADYQLLQQREDLARLEDEYRAYCDTPAGRFALWYAARHRPPPASR